MDMREQSRVPVSDANYPAFDHQVMKDQVIENNDPSAAGEIAQAWKEFGQKWADVAISFKVITEGSRESWSGEAAEAARAQFTEFGEAAHQLAEQHTSTGNVIAQQASAAETAKNSMPDPVPYNPAQMFREAAGSGNPLNMVSLLWEIPAQKAKSEEAHNEAVRVMTERDSAFQAAASGLPGFTEAPTQNGSGDATTTSSVTGVGQTSGDAKTYSSGSVPGGSSVTGAGYTPGGVTVPGGVGGGYPGGSGNVGGLGGSGGTGTRPSDYRPPVGNPGPGYQPPVTRPRPPGMGPNPGGYPTPPGFVPGPGQIGTGGPGFRPGPGGPGGAGGGRGFGPAGSGAPGVGRGGAGFGPTGSGVGGPGAGGRAGAFPGAGGAAAGAEAAGLRGGVAGAAAGRGGVGAAGAAGMGAGGRGGQGEEDKEHSSQYLVPTDEYFDDERRVAPPVIGA